MSPMQAPLFVSSVSAQPAIALLPPGTGTRPLKSPLEVEAGENEVHEHGDACVWGVGGQERLMSWAGVAISRGRYAAVWLTESVRVQENPSPSQRRDRRRRR